MTNKSEPEMQRMAGLMTSQELLARGVTKARLKTRLQRGELTAVWHGVYGITELVTTVRARPGGDEAMRAAAAVMALGAGNVVSHQTAASLHRLDVVGPRERSVVISRAAGTGGRHSWQGVRVHTATLPEAHVTSEYGIPVTTVARTVIDLARMLPFGGGVVVADSALHRKRASKEDLRAVLRDCAQWRGSRRAAETVEFADRRSESPLESLARALFHEHGLPAPQLQVTLGGSDPIGRVDFYWPDFRTVVEVDGALKYSDPRVQAEMRARSQLLRDAALREAGFEVVHLTWDDVVNRPDHVIAVLLAAFERGRRNATATA
jgi:predicted transcriptional regulator of viral defense system/very-short-patch-repair endonuclease